MTRCWLALIAQPAPDATAQAEVHDADGTLTGWLAAWRQRAKPLRAARRVDDRIVDPDGAPAWISLVLPPDGTRLAFDDLAVQHARRRVLAEPPQDAVSTLMRDASHFEGSITVARGPGVARLADDPFARIFPASILRVGPGVLGPRRRPPARRSSATAAPTRGRGTASTWEVDREHRGLRDLAALGRPARSGVRAVARHGRGFAATPRRRAAGPPGRPGRLCAPER